MNILVTGSSGFIGKNLVAWLGRREGVRVLGFDQENTQEEMVERLAVADLVYHLAGVNRPPSVEEFHTGNVDLTAQVCERLLRLKRPVPVVLSSSIQAELDNPYGTSKRQAEEVVIDYARRGGHGLIFRLPNVFGKWCRPNYNSVVATFCHNIARDLPITISDPGRMLELVHVDDVVRAFLQVAAEVAQEHGRYSSQVEPSQATSAVHESQASSDRSPLPPSPSHREVTPVYTITLGRLAELIRSFRQMRQSLVVPDLGDDFTRKLYGTYLSYLPEDSFAYDLDQKCDPRGCLAEFVKSPPFGQIFVSRTAPGITRGNHFHHTKAEKFLVLQGEAVIRFRPVLGGEVVEYFVRGQDFRVLDIPPGYTHSIENVGNDELVTLFWASEVFDPAQPDTIWEQV